jgi:predicted lipid-binding transport protein (Tim44 family)
MVITSLIMGLVIGGYSGLVVGLRGGLVVGLVVGLVLFPVLSLYFGGAAVIQHYTLRLVLWRTGTAPLNYVPFLDYAAERIFLRRVGGGYIFIHRMLMEYFASLEPKQRKDEGQAAQ